MKQLSFYAFATALLFTAGCSKDDPAKDILGTWKASKVISTGCTDTNENQNLTFSNGCYVESTIGLELCLTITFNDNNTYSTVTTSKLFGTQDTDVENGTYSISGDKLSLCPAGSACSEDDFTVSSSSLLIKTTDTDSKCYTELTLTK